MTFEEKVDNLVDTLGCSIKEAEEIVRADEKIDKGEKLFEQTKEQQKASKQYRQGSKAPTVYKLEKRERKADADKRHLIALLDATLAEIADEEPKVENVERQIDFVFKGRKFRVVLSAPRS